VRYHYYECSCSSRDKIYDVKDRFYEELEQVFDKFPKYQTKIVFGDFNPKVGREDTFKPTIGNESLHEISNDNGVRGVNFATSKNLIVKSKMFPYRNIYKFTWIFPDGKTHNQIDHLLRDRRRIQIYLMSGHSWQQIVTLTLSGSDKS
jgi:hypothetical protein